MSILTQALLRFGRKALHACLPNSCLLCGANSNDLLCPGCTGDLPVLSPERCPRCALPVRGGIPCGSCLSNPFHFDSAVALYRYEFPLDRLIRALKYGGQPILGTWFGHRLADALAGQQFDRIIPMPLHPSRLAERGFNQSAEIARVVSRRLAVALDLESCRRTRRTPAQAELPWKARQANVRGAFECTVNLSGARILLVDDVMTTGATLDECARTLRLHGAETIAVAVVARALRN